LDGKNVKKDWETLREKVYNTAEEIMGPITKKHNDWFDNNSDEIKQLLAEKSHLHNAYQSDPRSAAKKDSFNNARKNIQHELRQMRDSWLSSKADEIQGFADRHDQKNFYRALKEIYGSTSPESFQILSAEGNHIAHRQGHISPTLVKRRHFPDAGETPTFSRRW
jgi:hypothetical protein